MSKQAKTNLFEYEVVQFMKSTVLTVGSNTYVTIGRPLYWGDSSSTETIDEVSDILLSKNYLDDARRNMMAAKKVQPADIALVVGRNDWVSGATYDQYNDHIGMFDHEKKSPIGIVIANTSYQLTGNANTNASSTSVTGNSTSFLTTLLVGDILTINNQSRSIISITNNTFLTVNSNFISSGISNTIIRLPNNKTVLNTAGLLTGNVDVGSYVRIGTETKEIVRIFSQYAAEVNTKFNYTHTGNETLLKIVDRYPLYANNFYARNSRDQVFKCLYTPSYANVALPSTVEPTIDIDGQLPEEAYIETGDLYKWKYLYTIPYGLKQKFFNSKWMPVVSDSNIVESSIDGRIDVIEVINSGSGYYLNGQSGNSASYPIITITGDGTDAVATAQIESGIVTELNILNGGSNYTKANITISDPFQLSNGTSASFDVIIGPTGGHGSDPAKELGCFTFMISVELNSTEGGKVPISGYTYGGDFDFRQIQLIRDPKYSNGVFAQSGTYITSYQVEVSDPGAANFINDETVFVGASLGSAIFTATVASFDVSTNKLYLINLDGDISTIAGSEIKGNSSAATGAILSITESEIDIHSGDTLYIENRLPIIRNINQTEQIRMAFSF